MYTDGILNYDYEVRIDLEDLIDAITGKLKAHMNDCEWDIDGDEVVIRATDTARFKHWHCDATLESPAEDDTELIDSINDCDVEQAVLDALHETEKIRIKVRIDEEYDYSPNEPDEDAIYDAWKDRQLEGDYYD